ncbi:MAG: MBL fold metallo-hydrolase [Clostridia bacterium]|jgi:ribonuclease BN (tRNA processing enzyme)
MNIELLALGTGSAFTINNYQTNFLLRVTDNGITKSLLIDCGTDIRFSLHDLGFSYLDIDALYISHSHGDHAAGIDYIAFCTYFDPRYKNKTGSKPVLFCETHLMRDLWDHSWRGSLECLEGKDATLETYFEAQPIKKNSSFEFAGIKFDLVQSIHVSAKYAVVDSFGLMFTDPVTSQRVYLTTDTQYAPETSMMAYYREADIIFHDCETLYKSGVHARYTSLVTLPAEIKSKIRLVHFQDNVLEKWDDWQSDAKRDGFHGFMKPGLIYPEM